LRQIQNLAFFTLALAIKSEVSLAWLAASLGTTARARGFEENIRMVRTQGHVVITSGKVQITESGLDLVGEVSGIADIKEKIAEMLSGPQAQLFRYLDKAYPDAYSLESIAETFGTTVRARGFEENVRFLRSNEIIAVAGGMAKRADWIPQ
jgi:hypothetical protein